MAGEATAADVVARLKERCRAELAAKEQELAEVRASLKVAKHVIHVTDTELAEVRASLEVAKHVIHVTDTELTEQRHVSLPPSLSLSLSLCLSLSVSHTRSLSHCLPQTHRREGGGGAPSLVLGGCTAQGAGGWEPL